MKTMWRVFASGLTILSELLAFCIALIWMDSYSHWCRVERSGRYGTAPWETYQVWTLSSGDGRIRVASTIWALPVSVWVLFDVFRLA